MYSVAVELCGDDERLQDRDHWWTERGVGRLRKSIALWAPAVLLVAGLIGFVSTAGFSQEGPEVSFSRDIVPMFVESCTSCHTGAAPREGSANLNLEPQFAYGDLVRVLSGQVPTMARVMPNDPDNSYLLHKLMGTHADVGGRGQRMPRGADPWTEEQIELVRLWILQGAPNN